jgi:hypothetical protein
MEKMAEMLPRQAIRKMKRLRLVEHPLLNRISLFLSAMVKAHMQTQLGRQKRTSGSLTKKLQLYAALKNQTQDLLSLLNGTWHKIK